MVSARRRERCEHRTSTSKVDPLRMEVLKNAFVAITEEMSATLYCSAVDTRDTHETITGLQLPFCGVE